MSILRIVIFSLDELNLTRILTVFKENLVKYKGKRISREYTFILFLILIYYLYKKIRLSMINFEQLAQKYDTPLYVYDAEKIMDNYHKFCNAFDVKDLKVHYACKALSNISILKLFKNMGAGLDCVSIQEVRLGLKAGFSAKDIIYTPNNVSEEEFEHAIKVGVKINVDNLQMLECLGINHPGLPVCIRINPHLMAGGNSKISVGHIDSKFGISIHQLPLVNRIVKRLNIPVEGLHVHSGSDILDPDIFLIAAELMFTAAREFENLTYIDFGSGFKVKYKENGLSTDIEQFGKVFSERFNLFCKEIGKDLTLRFEPGKYMVSEAGYFLTKVNVIKQTTACTFLGIDTGFNHLIRPMFYDAYHKIENISNPTGDKKIYTVVGYICETDTFGSDRIINEVRKNDLLLFRNAGAYCFSMASNYNSRYRPAEVLMYQGEDYLIRKREEFSDLLHNQVMVDLDVMAEPETVLELKELN